MGFIAVYYTCDFYTLFQYIDTFTNGRVVYSHNSARASVHFLFSDICIRPHLRHRRERHKLF